ncbi:MAG: hypothetical protein QGH62_00350, partial [Nitrospinaceae bacterium]|nr:hypothetical protein [Nitrospinaceae bacterium]
MIFYYVAEPNFVFVLLLSILINFCAARYISRSSGPGNLLIAALPITINLLILGYYKYSGFLVENLNLALDADIDKASLILPLAISFFTFQEIAFVLDVRAGRVRNLNLL